jgi:hypothetical protein
VGYGDVNPKSNNEMLFDIFVMLNGVIIFSYSVSALSNVHSIPFRSSWTKVTKAMDTMLI